MGVPLICGVVIGFIIIIIMVPKIIMMDLLCRLEYCIIVMQEVLCVLSVMCVAWVWPDTLLMCQHLRIA